MIATPSYHFLCINSGSSSLKIAIYKISQSGETVRLSQAQAIAIGQPQARISIDGQQYEHQLKDPQSAFSILIKEWGNRYPVDAIGHRIVHGGSHTRPAIITTQLIQELNALKSLAPLHNASAIEIIKAAKEHYPSIPQVACFDTAFHATLPEMSFTLPLPSNAGDPVLRRYGFHGLSYEYITRKLGNRGRGRLIIAHLGNGSSLSAIQDGRCIDTTMGLTPAGGVMMGTRSGDLDPGVLFYLARTKRLDINALEKLVNEESGLLGVSGISSEMMQLLNEPSPSARLAIQIFAYQVRKSIGAMTASLGGLDRLVFTGGIGENAAAVRWIICRDLDYLGIQLNTNANDAHAKVISNRGSHCTVEVIATDEDAMVARHTYETLVDNS